MAPYMAPPGPDVMKHAGTQGQVMRPAARPNLASLALWLEQVTVRCCLKALRSGGEATLELEDDRLGRIRIDVLLQGRSISARIAAATDLLPLLEEALPRLKQALAEQELEIEVELLAEEEGRGSRAAEDPEEAEESEESDPAKEKGKDRPTGRRGPPGSVDLIV